MPIDVYGVPASIDATHWAQLLQDLGNLGSGNGVATGLVPSAATGTRLIGLTAGRSVQAGTLAVMDADDTIALDANTGSLSRIDVVCMQVDWAHPGDSAGTLVAVKGTPAATPTVPGLTQTPGVLWQEPLAQVLVRAGVGQIASGDVTDVRHLHFERTCSGTVTLSDGGTSPASRDIVFPAGFFTQTPQVVMTNDSPLPSTGTDLFVVAGNRSATGFTARINCSNNASRLFSWVASGV